MSLDYFYGLEDKNLNLLKKAIGELEASIRFKSIFTEV